MEAEGGGESLRPDNGGVAAVMVVVLAVSMAMVVAM